MNKLIDLVMEISREMHTLKAFVEWERQRLSQRMSGEWLDGKQVMTVLKISKRNLQNMRDDGILPYSQIRGKLYYKAEDIEKLLEEGYLKRVKSEG